MHFVMSLHEKYPKRRQHYKHSQNAYFSDLVSRGDAKQQLLDIVACVDTHVPLKRATTLLIMHNIKHGR